jgi:hypothetical protein
MIPDKKIQNRIEKIKKSFPPMTHPILDVILQATLSQDQNATDRYEQAELLHNITLKQTRKSRFVVLGLATICGIQLYNIGGDGKQVNSPLSDEDRVYLFTNDSSFNNRFFDLLQELLTLYAELLITSQNTSKELIRLDGEMLDHIKHLKAGLDLSLAKPKGSC